MICVTLDSRQWEQAVEVGLRRQESAVHKGLKDTHGLDVDSEEGGQLHVFGAAAEIASAMALNEKWEGDVDTFKRKPDVPPCWDIRRRSKWKYDMLVRKGDPMGRKMVHVVGTDRQYAVVGYLPVEECKNQQWLRNYGGRSETFFVPIRSLVPLGKSLFYPD